MGKYVLQLTATPALEHVRGWRSSRYEERFAHLIEFARYATSSNYLTEQLGESGVFGGCSSTASYVYS